MQVGKRIYYDCVTGDVISISGEYAGENVVDKGIDFDFSIYEPLMKRAPETVQVIQLEFGEHEDEFKEGRLIRVDPTSKDLIFVLNKMGNSADA